MAQPVDHGSGQFNHQIVPVVAVFAADVHATKEGDGVVEQVVLGDTGNSVRLQAKDAFTGSLSSLTYLESSYRAQAIAVAPDLDGNGVDDVVLLGLSATGSVRLQSKDPVTDNTILKHFYNKDYSPTQILVLPDVTGNGKPEFGVVGINDSDEIQIHIKDSDTEQLVNKLYAP